MTRPAADLTYTIPEAASALGVSPRFMHTLIARGLPCMQLGKRRVIVKTALERWVLEHANSTIDGSIP
jgi:excisionase family DNA binding protein